MDMNTRSNSVDPSSGQYRYNTTFSSSRYSDGGNVPTFQGVYNHLYPTPLAPHLDRNNRNSAMRNNNAGSAAYSAAGRSAETALEIDDSDSDDDDVVEVVAVAANV